MSKLKIFGDKWGLPGPRDKGKNPELSQRFWDSWRLMISASILPNSGD